MEEEKELEGGPVLQGKKPISARRKWLKRILIGLFALLTLLFSGLVLAVTVYEDEIVTYALQAVQGNLKTKSSIRDADLTLWNNFPSVSIRFKDIYVEEDSKTHDTLLFAKELYLSFDILDLFSGKYNIDEIEAKDGSFNMRVDRKGHMNWDVWKADTSSTSNEKFKIDLEDIVGENISYLYEDEQEKTFVDVKLKKLQASGKFTENDEINAYECIGFQGR
jgi:AsmA protein